MATNLTTSQYLSTLDYSNAAQAALRGHCFRSNAETIVSSPMVAKNRLGTPSPELKAALQEQEKAVQELQTLFNCDFGVPFSSKKEMRHVTVEQFSKKLTRQKSQLSTQKKQRQTAGLETWPDKIEASSRPYQELRFNPHLNIDGIQNADSAVISLMHLLHNYLVTTASATGLQPINGQSKHHIQSSCVEAFSQLETLMEEMPQEVLALHCLYLTIRRQIGKLLHHCCITSSPEHIGAVLAQLCRTLQAFADRLPFQELKGHHRVVLAVCIRRFLIDCDGIDPIKLRAAVEDPNSMLWALDSVIEKVNTEFLTEYQASTALDWQKRIAGCLYSIADLGPEVARSLLPYPSCVLVNENKAKNSFSPSAPKIAQLINEIRGQLCLFAKGDISNTINATIDLCGQLHLSILSALKGEAPTARAYSPAGFAEVLNTAYKLTQSFLTLGLNHHPYIPVSLSHHIIALAQLIEPDNNGVEDSLFSSGPFRRAAGFINMHLAASLPKNIEIITVGTRNTETPAIALKLQGKVQGVSSDMALQLFLEQIETQATQDRTSDYTTISPLYNQDTVTLFINGKHQGRIQALPLREEIMSVCNKQTELFNALIPFLNPENLRRVLLLSVPDLLSSSGRHLYFLPTRHDEPAYIAPSPSPRAFYETPPTFRERLPSTSAQISPTSEGAMATMTHLHPNSASRPSSFVSIKGSPEDHAWGDRVSLLSEVGELPLDRGMLPNSFARTIGTEARTIPRSASHSTLIRQAPQSGLGKRDFYTEIQIHSNPDFTNSIELTFLEQRTTSVFCPARDRHVTFNRSSAPHCYYRLGGKLIFSLYKGQVCVDFDSQTPPTLEYHLLANGAHIRGKHDNYALSTEEWKCKNAHLLREETLRLSALQKAAPYSQSLNSANAYTQIGPKMMGMSPPSATFPPSVPKTHSSVNTMTQANQYEDIDASDVASKMAQNISQKISKSLSEDPAEKLQRKLSERAPSVRATESENYEVMTSALRKLTPSCLLYYAIQAGTEKIRFTFPPPTPRQTENAIKEAEIRPPYVIYANRVFQMLGPQGEDQSYNAVISALAAGSNCDFERASLLLPKSTPLTGTQLLEAWSVLR